MPKMTTYGGGDATCAQMATYGGGDAAYFKNNK